MAYKIPFKIVRHVYTSDATYTPTAGMCYCEVECIGGGGGSGATEATTPNNYASGTGGGGGGYARKIIDAATVGASQAVTVGLGGIAGADIDNDGGTGGTSSFGTILSASGGLGGDSGYNSPLYSLNGYPGGSGSDGDINGNGGNSSGQYFEWGKTAIPSTGGNSIYGSGGLGIAFGIAAQPGLGYGGGAGGVSRASSLAALVGAAGAGGVVIVTEYVI